MSRSLEKHNRNIQFLKGTLDPINLPTQDPLPIVCYNLASFEALADDLPDHAEQISIFKQDMQAAQQTNLARRIIIVGVRKLKD